MRHCEWIAIILFQCLLFVSHWAISTIHPAFFVAPFPIEMPGPPTNIAISNISPRSVTLQFKPGYDGKTSISRWLVEAQVVQNKFTLRAQAITFFISHHWSLSFICCTFRSVLSEKTRSGSWPISWPMSLMHDPLRSWAWTPTRTTGPSPATCWNLRCTGPFYWFELKTLSFPTNILFMQIV